MQTGRAAGLTADMVLCHAIPEQFLWCRVLISGPVCFVPQCACLNFSGGEGHGLRDAISRVRLAQRAAPLLAADVFPPPDGVLLGKACDPHQKAHRMVTSLW